jgi:hypothetical protein
MEFFMPQAFEAFSFQLRILIYVAL